MNGFVTTGRRRRKEGEDADELDRSLEGIEDHSEERFNRGNSNKDKQR